MRCDGSDDVVLMVFVRGWTWSVSEPGSHQARLWPGKGGPPLMADVENECLVSVSQTRGSQKNHRKYYVLCGDAPLSL